MLRTAHIFRNRFRRHHPRLGFTLIELMVVVSILILIAAMTISAVNLNINNDKVRAAARQVQSYLAGARDRAIYSKSPRGVRFLLSLQNSPSEPSRTVSSMVFIAPSPPWTQGTIQMERLNIDADPSTADGYNSMTNPLPEILIVRGFDDPSNPNSGVSPTDWYSLKQQQLLAPGSRIRIPAENGDWYVVDDVSQVTAANPRLRLRAGYSGPTGGMTVGSSVNAFDNGYGPQTYLLELPPSVLPNQDPVVLPKGSVIHLDRCTSVGNLEQTGVAPNRGDKLPDAWKRTPSISADPTGFDYGTQLDVMFSPRGVVTGPAAQRGVIHFYICDQKDADTDYQHWHGTNATAYSSAPEYGPWTSYIADPTYERGDKVILSLFTRTGAISTHQIYSNADPFRFAETGEVAGK